MKLSSLILDPSAQPRVRLDSEAIDDYASAMQEGKEFPPVVAYGTERRAFLADGWHRYHAAQAIGLAEIAVDLRPGNLDDAVWHSVTTNAEHGLRRSNEDKQRAITTALTLRPTLADSEIARHCSVHHSTVSGIRKRLEQAGAIEAAPVRETTRAGEPSRQRVRAPSAPVLPPPLPEGASYDDAPDEPFSDDDEAPGAPPLPHREPQSVHAGPSNGPAEGQIDEARAAAVLKTIRYRRLRLFAPARAAVLLSQGPDALDSEEMQEIAAWFDAVSNEMAEREEER
jgi:hypothetical protein